MVPASGVDPVLNSTGGPLSGRVIGYLTDRIPMVCHFTITPLPVRKGIIPIILREKRLIVYFFVDRLLKSIVCRSKTGFGDVRRVERLSFFG